MALAAWLRALLLVVVCTQLLGAGPGSPGAASELTTEERLEAADRAFERGDDEAAWEWLRGEPGQGPKWQELAPIPEGERLPIHEILNAIENDEGLKAIALVEQELARLGAHVAEEDREYAVVLHSGLLRMTGTKAFQEQAGPLYDREARDMYLAGMRQAEGNARLVALMDGANAAYFSQTGRNGFASVYATRELRAVRRTGTAFERMNALMVIGGIYSDMGQPALRDRYREEAAAAAEEHMAGLADLSGLSPMDAKTQLRMMDRVRELQYLRMSDLARAGRHEEAAVAFHTYEAITQTLPGPRFWHWARAAFALGRAGVFDDAWWLIERARETAKAEGEDPQDWYIACMAAGVHVAQGEPVKAEPLTAQCLAGQPNPGIVDLRMRGEALEGVGRLAEAMDVFAAAVRQGETLRQSFSVADRAGFYNGTIREAHWGLIRVAARKAAGSGLDADFLAALEASEQMRSRQLGDLLDRKALARISVGRLASLRQGLADDQLVLAYVLMDRHIVALGYDRTRFEIHVVGHDGAASSERLRKMVALLSDPKSDPAALREELLLAGRGFLAPFEPLLEGKRRILVLPDGALSLLPFDLLIVPGTGRALVEGHVVTSTPSLRYIAAHTGAEAEAGQGLFALADPTFRGAVSVAGLPDSELSKVRGAGNVRGYIAPLPATRSEVESIGALFAGEPVVKLLGAGASESALKRRPLRGYRFLHLATHGILGGDVPGIFEPALVLAEEHREDGFLLASEAMRLDVDAELTVLSACKTGTGELVSGEGVMGMSRAFLVAGSRSVLVSLWEVDSAATEVLMVAFYRELRAGKTAAEALRGAKRALRDGRLAAPGSTAGGATSRGIQITDRPASTRSGTQHPYYWAAFVLVGT